MKMKRTLCLLLTLILLVGVMAPAALANGTQEINIRCSNWNWNIPVTEFQYEFEYSSEGIRLESQPCFYYEEGGEQRKETGCLRDIPYSLQFRFLLDDSYQYSYVNARLNKKFVDKVSSEETAAGRVMQLTFNVAVRSTVSEIRIETADLRPGAEISSQLAWYHDLSVSVAILKGDTPQAPELDLSEGLTYEAGQTYLMRFMVRPHNLNVDIVDDFQVILDRPLQYCPELTQVDVDGYPDNLLIYARYDCRNSQPLEVAEVPEGSTYIETEAGINAVEAIPGTMITAQYTNTNMPQDYVFTKWKLEGVTVPEEMLYNDTIQFEMPDNPVKITPVLEQYVCPFEDVDQNDWFYDGVRLADQIGLTTGVTDTQFAPYQSCTRAQFAAYLVRILLYEEELPTEFERENPFTDVKEGDWYYGYVRTAYDLGLISGKTETSFEPNVPISRAEIVTMLWRLANEEIAEGAECPFTDVRQDAYYYDAVVWANSYGFVNGVSATRFEPNRAATRAEALMILLRPFLS